MREKKHLSAASAGKQGKERHKKKIAPTYHKRFAKPVFFYPKTSQLQPCRIMSGDQGLILTADKTVMQI